ncbi:MAG: hypothetical protein FWF50_06150 [Defluviitaleaceae bacterium]|nr:hypothetical protein [Defluviitaleaceae bacterium]
MSISKKLGISAVVLVLSGTIFLGTFNLNASEVDYSNFVEAQIVSENSIEAEKFPEGWVSFNLNGGEYEQGQTSRLTVDRRFALTVGRWTTIGSENNLFTREIFIENRFGNPGNIKIEVRDGNNNLIAFNHDVPTNRGIRVTVPHNAGRYSVQVQPVSVSGNYQITVSRP